MSAPEAEYECQIGPDHYSGWRWDVFYRRSPVRGGWARSRRKARRDAERACRTYARMLERLATPSERWTPDL